MSILELKSVRAGYGRLTVLFDLDLEIQPGEWLSIVGANGAGRSTILKTIMGGATVTAGDVFFAGERISHLAPHRRVATGISLSPEARRILPTLSVRENLMAGAYTLGSRELADQLEVVYGVFPILRERSPQRGGSLSGGEQQMLAIGRALMSRPRLLLVDELSLGLAPIITERIYETLASLRDGGLAILVVDQEHAHISLAGFCDRQLVLEKGRFVNEGTLEEPLLEANGYWGGTKSE